jgi:hypothetical protein
LGSRSGTRTYSSFFQKIRTFGGKIMITTAVLLQGLKIYASVRIGWKVATIAYKSVKTVKAKKEDKKEVI